MYFRFISPTTVVLLFGALAGLGNCTSRENDQVIAALIRLGPAATSFCSSFLGIPKKTVTARTITPTVYAHSRHLQSRTIADRRTPQHGYHHHNDHDDHPRGQACPHTRCPKLSSLRPALPERQTYHKPPSPRRSSPVQRGTDIDRLLPATHHPGRNHHHRDGPCNRTPPLIHPSCILTNTRTDNNHKHNNHPRNHRAPQQLRPRRIPQHLGQRVRQQHHLHR